MAPADVDERAQAPGASTEQLLLREVVEALAPLERSAGSAAERDAAEWLAGRLERAGAPARVEEEQFLDGYAALIGALTAVGALAGAAAIPATPLRPVAGLVALAAGAAVADDVSNGPRVARRAVQRPRTTWNVVAEAGEAQAERTLVVLAHHDAARSGRVFESSAQRAFGERFPGVLERMDTSLALWQAVLAGPALVATGALRGRRGALGLGTALCALATAAFRDIARSPFVPGANDNLSGVAVLVALAERLRSRPVAGLRVLLVSCGAEEVVQGGIYGFGARHFPGLDRERTWVLNLDTVGSPRLVLVEGEGPLVMEDYVDVRFRDLVARAAVAAGVPLRRGMRARTSTDAVIPSRAGYPTATLVAVDRYKALSNYHQMSDTPENVDYGTVAQAVSVSEAVARELGS